MVPLDEWPHRGPPLAHGASRALEVPAPLYRKTESLWNAAPAPPFLPDVGPAAGSGGNDPGRRTRIARRDHHRPAGGEGREADAVRPGCGRADGGETAARVPPGPERFLPALRERVQRRRLHTRRRLPQVLRRPHPRGPEGHVLDQGLQAVRGQHRFVGPCGRRAGFARAGGLARRHAGRVPRCRHGHPGRFRELQDEAGVRRR